MRISRCPRCGSKELCHCFSKVSGGKSEKLYDLQQYYEEFSPPSYPTGMELFLGEDRGRSKMRPLLYRMRKDKVFHV